jgi:hypothetical protein
MFDAKNDRFLYIPSNPVEQAAGTAEGRPTPFAQPDLTPANATAAPARFWSRPDARRGDAAVTRR